MLRAIKSAGRGPIPARVEKYTLRCRGSVSSSGPRRPALGLGVTTSVVAFQTWDQIKADFGLNWFIYLSMPFVAAFVGYTTKLVALQMLYRPIEFVGIGPFGWQGVVPRRAGKTASLTIQMLTDKLLKPESCWRRSTPSRRSRICREPLTPADRRDESRARGSGAPRARWFRCRTWAARR